MKDLKTSKDKDYTGLGKTQRKILAILNTFDPHSYYRPAFPPPDGPTLDFVPEHDFWLCLDELGYYFDPDDFKSQHDNLFRAIRTLEWRGLVGICVEKDICGGDYVCCWSLVRETLNPILEKDERRTSCMK